MDKSRLKEVEKLLQNWDGRTELKFDIPEFGSINDFHDLLNDNNVPDNLPEIGQMELFKSSKLTDFINGSFLEQYGLLINEKTKNLLIKFNLGKYKSYTFQVIYKDSANLDYYFLRNAASIDKFIDYKKSKFYSQEGLLEFDKRNNLELNSLEEINNYKEKVKNKDIYIFASEIYLNNDFPNYDLFKCNIYGIHGVYISKELKDSLENSSGVIIRTTNRIKN